MTTNVSNRLYDILKFLSLILLPAVGTAYTSLDLLWDLPAETKVVGTIVVVDTFLGVFVAWLKNGYEEPEPPISGTINYPGDDENGMPHIQLAIQRHPTEMADDRGIAYFKVENNSDLTEQ